MINAFEGLRDTISFVLYWWLNKDFFSGLLHASTGHWKEKKLLKEEKTLWKIIGTKKLTSDTRTISPWPGIETSGNSGSTIPIEIVSSSGVRYRNVLIMQQFLKKSSGIFFSFLVRILLLSKTSTFQGLEQCLFLIRPQWVCWHRAWVLKKMKFDYFVQPFFLQKGEYYGLLTKQFVKKC